MSITIDQQIKCLKKESERRKKVLPLLVEQGRMSEEAAGPVAMIDGTEAGPYPAKHARVPNASHEGRTEAAERRCRTVPLDAIVGRFYRRKHGNATRYVG